jgi:hypothetical protein
MKIEYLSGSPLVPGKLTGPVVQLANDSASDHAPATRNAAIADPSRTKHAALRRCSDSAAPAASIASAKGRRHRGSRQQAGEPAATAVSA